MAKHLYIVETERRDKDGCWMVEDELEQEVCEDASHLIRAAAQWPLEPNQMIFVRKMPGETLDYYNYENVYERFGGYMKKNTKIYYLYRDASNYKQWNEVVINGVLTEEDIKTILDCRIEGEWFIPSKIGMPEVRCSEEWTEDDHDYFEIDEDSFEIVEEKPTLDVRPKELVREFQWKAEHGWN